MLQGLSEQIQAATDGRYIHLVAENSENQAGWLKRRDDGRPQFYTAQWDDDLHHCLHALVTGESFWYYADFKGRVDLTGRALAEGFAWQGEYMEHEGNTKGEPSAFPLATAFVSYMQNHDQIGNRPFGDRINRIAPRATVRALIAINLLLPHIPLLFMGEEWAAEQPFLFFSDMGEDLAETIRQSRKEELKDAPGSVDPNRRPPDPMAEESFLASKLTWDDLDGDESRRYMSIYKRLIALRQKEIVPRLSGMLGHCGQYEILGPCAFQVDWTLGDGSKLCLIANLSPDPLNGVNVWAEDHLWLEGFATDHTLDAWSVVFKLS